MTYMRCGAGSVPASLTLVHGSGPLRLTSGLRCARAGSVAHKNHSRSGRFATIGSTSEQSFRGAGGSTSRSGETLDGFFFDSRMAIRGRGALRPANSNICQWRASKEKNLRSARFRCDCTLREFAHRGATAAIPRSGDVPCQRNSLGKPS